ncbi:hypothetical protein HNR23_002726 [Nocardiopsis mwathae]|uniref:Uncharacterized protein n=1 Tax=Nocardiopsis mwathae TaxID=1472723 RepID=A0A7W9YJG8_9ACTN|nr:hypothetical protein [Nocardiopsis mwathae]MBB6172666.1 hypothetical protein [Nocardiopsis mwathae]
MRVVWGLALAMLAAFVFIALRSGATGTEATDGIGGTGGTGVGGTGDGGPPVEMPDPGFVDRISEALDGIGDLLDTPPS